MRSPWREYRDTVSLLEQSTNSKKCCALRNREKTTNSHARRTKVTHRRWFTSLWACRLRCSLPYRWASVPMRAALHAAFLFLHTAVIPATNETMTYLSSFTSGSDGTSPHTLKLRDIAHIILTLLVLHAQGGLVLNTASQQPHCS